VLTKRIIACLDVSHGRVVKGVNFINLKDAGDPAELAHRHAASGADEIVLLDITATHEKRGILLDAVRRTARELFVPFTVGGGVRSLDDAATLFEAGADKITINSAAVASPELITEIAQRFGSQAVVIAIDAKSRTSEPTSTVPRFDVYVTGGRTSTGRDALEWAKEVESRGAGEIMLTSMDRDGTQVGFDCPITAAMAQNVSIPVIASGGAGTAGHFVEVFTEGHADAALAASIFHYGIANVGELKQTLLAASIPVRWPC
jgi:imidazole glycerol-phosphate synthase subunit HisF